MFEHRFRLCENPVELRPTKSSASPKQAQTPEAIPAARMVVQLWKPEAPTKPKPAELPQPPAAVVAAKPRRLAMPAQLPVPGYGIASPFAKGPLSKCDSVLLWFDEDVRRFLFIAMAGHSGERWISLEALAGSIAAFPAWDGGTSKQGIAVLLEK
jgi:hypothetical protein